MLNYVGFLVLVVCGAASAVSLGSYSGDSNKVSVSGISSGAFMSVQLQVAHSKTFMGAGIVAGGPYYCAQASALIATSSCMTEPSKIPVGYLQQVTENAVLTGTVDPLSNLYEDRIYLFSGSNDHVVVPGVMHALEDFYLPYTNPANIKSVFNVGAGHSFVTDGYGNPCSSEQMPYINDCSYNQAYEILNHIYGGLTKPSGYVPLAGEGYEFDQSEFVFNPNNKGMSTRGFIYVPSGCNKRFSNCPVHVSLHGCEQADCELGTEYAVNTGYNEVAELNNIIIIYPQAHNSAVTPLNPYGCWDWWGYTGLDYASKLGNQIKAIKGMVDKVLS